MVGADGGQTGLIGLVERLLAGAAVLGATIFVLLNALYIEFYDDFGVRPEEIGLDRLAVLGRAAWVALAVLILAVPVAYVAGVVALAKPEEKKAAPTRRRSPELVRQRRVRLTWAIATTLLVYVLAGYWLLRAHVEERANEVREGASVGGIGWFVPLIDVRAIRADVHWVGDIEKKPPSLDEDHLLYLGRGETFVAIVSCGDTTVMVRPDDVIVEIIEKRDPDDVDAGGTLPASC